MHTHAPLASTAGPVPGQISGRMPDIRAGDLLPPLDFAIVALVGYASHAAQVTGLVSTGGPTLAAWSELSPLVWLAAVIAPFMLYLPRFGADIAADRGMSVLLGHARGSFSFVAVIGLLGYAGGWLDAASASWAGLWLAGTVCLTAGSRLLLARHLRPASVRSGGEGSALPDPYRRKAPRQLTELVGDSLAVQVLVNRPLRGWNAVMKSTADLVLTALICIAVLPLLASIALVIRLDSPGPILFRQKRHGINNHEFDILKFRTMRHADSDSAPGAALRQTTRDDDRITRVGRVLRKWSLDELPQLFNVLGGSMSLVGPRPHAVNMRTEGQLGDQITDEYPHRHRIKPGITGWSQINGARGATDTVAQLRRRVDLDLYYVDHWSLLLDLRILFLTSREVVRATNAY